MDPWGLPYKIVTKKLIGWRPIPGIMLLGRLEHIVDTLFPRQASIKWSAIVKNMTFPEVACEEIEEFANRFPSGRAPRLYRIPNLVIKEITKSRPIIMRKIFNLYFRDRYFPSEC